MGDGMARNLIEGGRDLIVWNRTGSKATDFSQQTGCETAKTPKEVREIKARKQAVSAQESDETRINTSSILK